jgi:hypothetical protein
VLFAHNMALPGGRGGEWDSFSQVQGTSRALTPAAHRLTRSAASVFVPHSDATCAELLQLGVLSGAALLAPHGACLFSAGSLDGEFGGRDAAAAAAAEQFVRPFLTADAEVVSVELRGVKHVVFHRDARSVYALSHGRAAGVCVNALPCGTLVTEYERPQNPRSVVAAVEACCAALR